MFLINTFCYRSSTNDLNNGLVLAISSINCLKIYPENYNFDLNILTQLLYGKMKYITIICDNSEKYILDMKVITY